MILLWLQQKRGAFGGAEGNVLATARALGARGHRNTLFFRESTGVAEDAWAEAFDQQICVPPGADLLAIARRLKPDLVWIHNWDDSKDFLRLRELGKPLGRMVHDHALYCMRHYKYHPLTRRNCGRPASLACLFPCGAFLQRGSGLLPVKFASLSKKLTEIAQNRQLDRVLVASNFMRDELTKNQFDPAIIRLLPPIPPTPEPVAADHFASSDPVDTSAPSVDFIAGRILFIGQVIRGKGVDLLLRALEGLDGNWHLSLAGQGSALPACRRLITKLGMDSRVTVLGHLDPASLARQYQEAQFLVVPSAWPEPFGMVGIEAMRHARAVVGFGVGGIPEWLRHEENGLLVPPGNIGAMRIAIKSLLDDPAACRRLGNHGWNLAQTEFSFSTYITGLEEFLNDLATVPLDVSTTDPQSN